MRKGNENWDMKKNVSEKRAIENKQIANWEIKKKRKEIENWETAKNGNWNLRNCI